MSNEERREFDPVRFGGRLAVLRGNRPRAEVAAEAGITEHTLGRYERGETEMRAFTDMVSLGKVLNLTPNHMAALAEIFVLPESESEHFEPEIANAVQRLRNYLLDVNQSERYRMATLLNNMIDMARFRGGLGTEPESETDIPRWVHQVRSVTNPTDGNDR